MSGNFHIITFGCQMNVRDSQWLAGALKARGFLEAEKDDADIILINSCSVRHKPERKVINTVERLLRANSNRSVIGVLGCVAQQCGRELLGLAPQVNLVAGPDNLGQVADAVQELVRKSGLKLALLEFAKEYPERCEVEESCAGRAAYVNIMQGCDNFCAYCIVPFTRGRQKSRSREAILTECKKWLDQGAVEITLLGQNVNAWGGKGNAADAAFASLLREIAELKGLQRLRFVTPHPADLGTEVTSCLGELEQLCPRVHLPLQAGSDRILEIMGRRHNRGEYLELVERLRESRGDLLLSTDLIVGFPGETEEDFEATLNMVEECGFISSFSFCYSDRPGARASLFPEKVPEPVKLERLMRLQELQDKITARLLAAQVGREANILLENPSPRGQRNSWQGKDQYGLSVNIEMCDSLDHTGELVTGIIKEAKRHSLVAELPDREAVSKQGMISV